MCKVFWLLPLLHTLREMSHLSSLMKIALATIAVSLHWPVLPGWWRSGDFHRNLNCWDTDCIARLYANIVRLFWRPVGLAVLRIHKKRRHLTYIINMHMLHLYHHMLSLTKCFWTFQFTNYNQVETKSVAESRVHLKHLYSATISVLAQPL